MVELIITEKPQAALKIATAISDKTPIKHSKGKAVYYEIVHKNKKIYVGCAVGHLFGLTEEVKSRWADYPTFDITWKPKYEIEKGSDYIKAYLSTLKYLGKKADLITVATDYDIEGAVIGYTTLKYGLGKDNARRMKFSTLTKDELIKSYDSAQKSLDLGMVNAGIARHHLDWFYGINLTKALSMSLKTSSGYFQVLSTGRVQGPTLKIIVKREEEIQKFVPEKYWEVYLDGLYKKNKILAKHNGNKFSDNKKVKKILKKTKGKLAIIDEINKKTSNQAPPFPFDLTSLQTEFFRHYKVSPKDTSNLAQELYISGLISYPRTSSQKLPDSIGYEKILKKLKKQKEYSSNCESLLKKKLKPNEGKKKDPAHPAIYPTGETANLSGRQAKLYDLIVRRFLAVFGEPAKKQTLSISIDVNKEIFKLTGTTTIDPGWHILYGKYAKFKEEELPEMNKGEEIKVKKILDEEKETQPPNRYSQASIIKELEKKNLGTKSTRALILDTLYERNYIQNQPIEATELGIKLIKTLKKYSPEIIDFKLTKEIEEDMEKIRHNKLKKETVIKNVKKILKEILTKFKKNESKIGKNLAEAAKETKQKSSEVGTCMICKKGKLRVIHSKKTRKRFVACDAYPKCKTTYGLPQQGLVKHVEKVCKHDEFPQVMIIRKGKRPWILCLNPDCPGREEWEKKSKKNKS